MILKSILGVLRARWVIVAAAFGGCLIGGGFVYATSPPRYQATAKVILDYIKPDPVTGEYVNSKMAQAYVNTQLEMVRDFQVAVPAAEMLGLLDDVGLQQAYAAEPGANAADFPRWVARRLISGTGARLLADSNIIIVSSVGTTREGALDFVSAIRTAYIRATIDSKRFGATDGATNLGAQAEKARVELGALEAAKRTLEDKTGGLPLMESRRLTKLVTDIRTGFVTSRDESASAPRLATVEAQLQEAAKTLGPNHPALRALEISRDGLRAQVELERSTAGDGARQAAMIEKARQAAIDVQVDKVLSTRETALEMRLLDEEIERRRDILNSHYKKIAELRQLANLEQSNLTPLGAPEVKSAPVFPNPWLILGGSGFLGLLLGCLAALLVELLNRRARHPHELLQGHGIPVLGVVPTFGPSSGRRWTLSAPRTRDRLPLADVQTP
ncbi:hypothetical protein [Phenylobacterium sp.]|uniref:GumC family protein n=1 Tax=Phenylobacterium sp. TaxID=1871053 RepID=UPI00301CA0CA